MQRDFLKLTLCGHGLSDQEALHESHDKQVSQKESPENVMVVFREFQ